MVKKSTLITVSTAFGFSIIALVITLAIFISTTKTYATQLENAYMRSFYELSSNIDDIEVDLSKLIASNSNNTRKTILTDVYNLCNVANTNISNMPVSNNNIENINEYINKLGGFSFSLIEKINKNTEWTTADVASINDLHSHALNLLFDYNTYLSSLSFDFRVLKSLDYKDDTRGINGEFNNINGTNSKVPTLIYDGPFSESVMNPEIKGLTENEISKEDAQSIVEEKLKGYNINEIKYDEETNGQLQTYNFKVKCENIDLYVQVTKRGGFIVEITSIGGGRELKLSVGESESLAKEFASNLGYTDLYPVWTSVNGNVIYINLAPIVNGVIYYPDLIKVKVDRALSLVTGWEARSYIYNHVTRNLPAPAISLSEAQKSVSSILTVLEKNKALIPNEFVGETLTYEFVCTWKNYTYYVYIDAVSGEEVNILRVINTNYGDLIL